MSGHRHLASTLIATRSKCSNIPARVGENHDRGLNITLDRQNSNMERDKTAGVGDV